MNGIPRTVCLLTEAAEATENRWKVYPTDRAEVLQKATNVWRKSSVFTDPPPPQPEPQYLYLTAVSLVLFFFCV